MSDINPRRMIPLHIADAAVAACDKKIAELKAERIHYLNQIGGLQEENARLKAEIDELKNQPDPLTAYLYAAELGKDAIKKLKAEVERLTLLQVETLNERNKAEAEVERLRKAGDELSWAFAFAVSRDDGKESGLIKAWNAAKEGKQS